MKLKLDRFPLARQIVLIVFALNLLVFAFMLGFINSSTSDAVLRETELQLQQQTHQVVQQFRLFDTSLKESTRQLSKVFAAAFTQPLQLNEDQTARTGNLDSSVLYLGETPLNNSFELVDRFSSVTGGTATIFVRQGDDFQRISTSLKKNNGERALGTLLGRQHPGYQALISGQPYEGVTRLFGRDYMARYEPVTDSGGRVIAILYVGLDFTRMLNRLKESVASVALGESGYVFAMYTGPGNNQGQLMLHPTRAGGDLLNDTDVDGNQPFRLLLKQQQGVFSFDLDSAKGDRRQKLVAFEQFADWQWTVAAIGDVDEITVAGDALLKQLVMIAVVAVLVLSLVTFLVVQSRLNPLQIVTDRLQRMGEGDLRADEHVDQQQHHHNSRNEITRLLQQSHNMREAFAELIAGLHVRIEELQHASADLNQITEQSHQQIALQQGEADQVATAVSEMAASIRDVATNVAQTSTATGEAQLGTEEVVRLAKDSSEASQQSADELQTTAEVIQSLAAETKNVEEVLDVIQGIAEQTNLLALNAAIEAARAGEQGRGFAVVASEVRNLAQRTQESTGQIQEMIDSLQRQAKEAVHSVESVQSQSATSLEQSHQTDEALSAIMQSIDQINDMTTQIASASEQQSVVAAQIESSVVNVKESSTKNAHSAGETSSASESLSEMATSLRQNVEQFSV